VLNDKRKNFGVKLMSSRKKKKDENSQENIKQIFERALDEDENDILTEDADMDFIPPIQKHHSTRKLFFILGFFVLIMSVVGIISTYTFVSGRVKDFADNTAQKNEFAEFIYPIVICDPPPFDKTVKMRNETIISAAIWDIILYDDKSIYPGEFDYIIVPELVVEQHAMKLFGDGLAIENQSIIGTDVQFYYDELLKSYRIPAHPRYFTYSPYIESISKVGERYTLMVGYLSPTPSWYTMTEEVPIPEKYVEYVVSKRGDTMQLVAITQVNEIGSDSGL
jgi:hypothetical protein